MMEEYVVIQIKCELLLPEECDIVFRNTKNEVGNQDGGVRGHP